MKLQRQELRNFYRYEQVRRSGKFNMITDLELAAQTADLEIDEYRNVIRRYSQYKQIIIREYGSIDDFMREFAWK